MDGQYLRTYRGAIVIISHDVALLDSLVSRTIAFYHGRAEEYAGNFSYFLKESELRKEILLQPEKGPGPGNSQNEGIHRPLPLQGHEGFSGAVPHQAVGKSGTD